MHPFPVVQIPLIHAAEQYLGGGNVGGNGYAVHITQAEQILLVGAAAVGSERVAEEQHQIHFIAGNTSGDLLNAAQMVTAEGADMVIANGSHPELLYDIADGGPAGTRFAGRKEG